jgi:precorrin-2 methylase
MANERAPAPMSTTSPVSAEANRIGDVLQTVFADRSAAAVAAHLAAGRSVAGVMHGVPVTIVPQPKRDRG